MNGTDDSHLNSLVIAGRQLWHRLNGEPPKAYACFGIYRDLGAKRSLVEACKRYYGTERAFNVRRVSEWSSAWHWVERCKHYDDRVDDELQAEMREQSREMVRIHSHGARLVVDKALEAAKLLDPTKLDASEIIKLLVEGAKLERLSRGAPAEVTEHKVVGHVDIFKRIEQYAAIYAARQGSDVQRDGAGESLDTPPTNGEAKGLPPPQ